METLHMTFPVKTETFSLGLMHMTLDKYFYFTHTSVFKSSVNDVDDRQLSYIVILYRDFVLSSWGEIYLILNIYISINLVLTSI